MHDVNAVKAIAFGLAADQRSFAGYYRWEVYYSTSSGLLLLPQGFDRRRPTSAAQDPRPPRMSGPLNRCSRAIPRRLLGEPVRGLPDEDESLSGRCCQADSEPEHAHVAQDQVRQAVRDRQGGHDLDQQER